MKRPSCRNSLLFLACACAAVIVVSTPAAADPRPGELDRLSTPLALPASTLATLADQPAVDRLDDPVAPPDPANEQEPEKPIQATRSFFGTLFHNLGDDVKHLPRRNSVYWVAGGAGVALAVHPADKAVNRHLLGSPGWDTFFKPGHIIGGTEVQVAAGLLTYGIGRYRGSNEVRHLGMDLMEAQLLTEGLVQTMKLIGRRPRPLNPDGTPNANTSFSFPSGHAAITFAGATVLEQHLGWKAAVPTYLVASYVALSRLHDNEHYLSDVAFGAATGVIIGRAVTWHGRNNYPITPLVTPQLVGMLIEWR